MNPPPPARVLIFPIPAQGHVNPMLKLAELLSLSGVHVTFLTTEHVLNGLRRKSWRFLFRTIPDGLPEDHPRSADRFGDLFKSVTATAKPLLRQFLVSETGVTCVIADGIFGGFPVDVGNELNIPVILFRTASACYFWVLCSLPDIIQSGELPLKDDDEDMDRLITSVPGMESFLRCRDLPSFTGPSNTSDASDAKLRLISEVTRQNSRAEAIILNTFEELEAPMISHIRARCNPRTYTIGPLHAHLEERLKKIDSTQTLDHHFSDTCMAWLDSQPPKSVVYVSFGSLTIMTRDQLMEFWHGLVNSEKRFLWVVRKDLLFAEEEDAGEFRRELSEATRDRGFVADWVPQEEVLSHQSVGGFLTHSGWNSTLESITNGVPMLCWPYFADQQINSRYVGQVWKLGIDMKDVCDRKVIAKMVNDLMVERRDEFAGSSAEMAGLAKRSVSEGGSSYRNLERLVSDIASRFK